MGQEVDHHKLRFKLSGELVGPEKDRLVVGGPEKDRLVQGVRLVRWACAWGSHGLQ